MSIISKVGKIWKNISILKMKLIGFEDHGQKQNTQNGHILTLNSNEGTINWGNWQRRLKTGAN